MAHFAQLDDENIVIQVIVVHNNELLDENGQESEMKGIEFCNSILQGNWKQTSYNSRMGKYFDQDGKVSENKLAFRKNYAGVGYKYDPDLDAFIPPKPEGNWILDEQTCQWEKNDHSSQAY